MLSRLTPVTDQSREIQERHQEVMYNEGIGEEYKHDQSHPGYTTSERGKVIAVLFPSTTMNENVPLVSPWCNSQYMIDLRLVGRVSVEVHRRHGAHLVALLVLELEIE